MRYGAVITAAGKSVRMEQYKQLMNIGDRHIAERVIVNFRRAGVKDIVMVTGCNADQLEKDLRDFDIIFVRNPEYESTKMFDSAKIGFEKLSSLPEKCGRIFFCPVTVPFFTDQTLAEEMKRMDADPDARVIIPAFRGKGGHPILIDSKALPEILACSGENGMKGACGSLPDGSTVRMEVSDEGVAAGSESTDNIRKLFNIHNERILHPVVKLTFASTTAFFGPGSVELLREVDRCGNVREACAKCGFSYSKGWTILRKCEEKFGYNIVERQVGGQNGGAAYVTEKGRDLLAVYEQLKSELGQMAEERFRELMYEYRLTGAVQENEQMKKGS